VTYTSSCESGCFGGSHVMPDHACDATPCDVVSCRGDNISSTATTPNGRYSSNGMVVRCDAAPTTLVHPLKMARFLLSLVLFLPHVLRRVYSSWNIGSIPASVYYILILCNPHLDFFAIRIGTFAWTKGIECWTWGSMRR